MIIKESIKVKKSGSKNSNARAWVGWDKHVYHSFISSFQKSGGSPAKRALMRAGKKEGGLGEGIFARLQFCASRIWLKNFARNTFEQRSAIATRRDFQNFLTQRIARSPRQRRGSLRKNPCISELNQKADGNQNGFFCSAFGGSWWQSRQSKINLMEFLMNAFAFQFFPPLADLPAEASVQAGGKRTKQVFNPALSAPKAQWPKATLLT